MVGAGERWKQGDSADSAMVSAGQRWWAMIQVVLQLSERGRPSERGGRGPKRGTSAEDDVAEPAQTPTSSPAHRFTLS